MLFLVCSDNDLVSEATYKRINYIILTQQVKTGTTYKKNCLYDVKATFYIKVQR